MSPGVAEGSTDLVLRDVRKCFGPVRVVDSCSLEVRRGEIIALLGPSGCGKTTLLNIIAGFERPDEGRVLLRGRDITHQPPNRRETGMVFQHFALFPHMTVSANVGYGLRARRLPRSEIDSRVSEMLDLLKLTGLEERYPQALSGGQRQRVAVARALAIRPQMLLLDEALSALDRNLREEMQIELSLLLRRLEITTILVTHDQREAFSLGNRIALMEAGRIVQVGSAREIYLRPQSSFVFRFLGSANTLSGTLREDGDGASVTTSSGIDFIPAEMPTAAGSAVRVYLRAEDIRLSPTPTRVHRSCPAKVLIETFLGATRRCVVELGDSQIVVDRPIQSQDPDLTAGQCVYLDFSPDAAHVRPDA
jgi:ABC-type Fe3+/spermidine/putrescine transport system ATPase subunit